MNKEQEDELLMQVAAGTDLLTAVAALPRTSDQPPKPQPSNPKASTGGVISAVLTFLVIIVLWWLTA
jgi:hypothetical protein